MSILATIVTPKENTAQLFFLIAAIVAAVAVVVGFVQREWSYYPILMVFVLLFVSIGLLFHP